MQHPWLCKLAVSLAVPLLCVTILHAQQEPSPPKTSADTELARIDSEITALKSALKLIEAAAKAEPSLEVKRLSQEQIQVRRVQLRSKQAERGVVERIAHLQKYQDAVAGTLAKEEKAQIIRQFKGLEALRSQCAAGCSSTDTIGSPVSSNAPDERITYLAIQPYSGEVSKKESAAPTKQQPSESDDPPKNGAAHAAETQPQGDAPKEKKKDEGTKGEEEPKAKLPLQAIKGRVLAGSYSNPLPGVTVQVRTEDGGSVVGTTVTDSNGNYEVLLLEGADYRLRVDCDCSLYKPIQTGVFKLASNVTQVLPDLHMEELAEGARGDFAAMAADHTPVSRLRGGELVRLISGFEQSGASASHSKQNFFFDMFVTVPFPIQNLQSYDRVFGPRFRLWGDIRISSAPRDFSQPIREFAASAAEQIGNTKVSEIAQSSDFRAGVEYYFAHLPNLLPSFDQATKQKFSISIIAAGGGITPLNPQDTISVFNSSPAAISQFNLPATTKFIAFVSPDRDRFFRQYDVGFRIKTHYFDLVDHPLYRFPATLDLTYGINESVTRGRVRGGVLKLEGFYPLPWDAAKYVYLFGTAMLKPARAKISNPLVLQAAPKDTPVPGPDTAIVTLPQIDRDYYRLGVGVDAVSLFKTILDKSAAKAALKKGNKAAQDLAAQQDQEKQNKK